MILVLVAIAILLAAILIAVTPPKEREGVLGLVYLGGFVLLFIASYQSGGLGEVFQGILFVLMVVWYSVPTLHDFWYGEPTVWTALALIPIIFVMLIPLMVVSAILETRHNTKKAKELSSE